MKTFFLISSLAFGTSTLLAGTPEVWRGTGETRSADNQPLKSYQMNVTREATAEGTIQMKVLVTGTDGSKLFEDTCAITRSKPGSWRKTCLKTKGGGYMLNDTLGTEYLADEQGRVWSTSIIIDGPKAMRLLRVELLNGQPQKWFAETLQKVN